MPHYLVFRSIEPAENRMVNSAIYGTYQGEQVQINVQPEHQIRRFEPVTVVQAKTPEAAVKAVVSVEKQLGSFFCLQGDFVQLDVEAAANEKGILVAENGPELAAGKESDE